MKEAIKMLKIQKCVKCGREFETIDVSDIVNFDITICPDCIEAEKLETERKIDEIFEKANFTYREVK
jgi:DNA-directed RNA polymerase subunit RPC12/RpoP